MSSARRLPTVYGKGAEAQVTAMARLQRGAPFFMTMDGLSYLQLLGTIQVALRHPENGAGQKMTAFAWAMRDELLSREPDLAPIIDAGWAVIPNDRRN